MTFHCHPPSSSLHPLLRKHRGYVLVVTLGLLVLAAGLMVAVSRGALRHATAARLAADELQPRWGAVSCRNATLPYAEVILGSAEAERKSPLPLYRTRIQLGDETFDLTIADELAKADVNLLLDHTDRATAENRLRQALAGSGLSSQIRLRPSGAPLPAPAAPATTKPATQPALPQLISGFGQIFTDASPEHLLMAQGSFRPADVVTCWS